MNRREQRDYWLDINQALIDLKKKEITLRHMEYLLRKDSTEMNTINVKKSVDKYVEELLQQSEEIEVKFAKNNMEGKADE